jgi:AraC-like DNA-binding protein
LLHIFLNKLLRQKSLSALQLQNRKYLPEFVKLQALVEAHCLETKKVEDYAEKMNLSTKTINNITQNILHKSAKQFIDEIVILQIKRLLTNPNLSIKEIAYQAGFEETTNFYKFFKKYVQNTPESFRGVCDKAFA